MSQDQLGLFDTAPDKKELRFCLALVGLLFAALAIFSVLPEIRVRQIDAFIPLADGTMFLGDLITATLLYVQAVVFRSRLLTLLASAYLLSALLLVAHLLSFPGAFAPGGLLGAKLNTTAWIGDFWRAGLPLAVIVYALLKRTDTEKPSAPGSRSAGIAVGVSGAFVLAGAITLLTTRGHDLLPQLFVDRYNVNHTNSLMVNCALITLEILALVALFRARKSVLDMWLLVVLSGWLAHALLNMQATGRFTVRFYGQFSMLMFCNLVLMLALLAESSRLYLRLALSTAARNRERDTRLMSMDAVAAAISHEIGQPLTAVTLNAAAGLGWLTRDQPDPEKAIQALRAISDAGKRSFDVVKSVRAMFAMKPGSESAFNLNDLVRETVSLLNRELAIGNVSVRLLLDEALPAVVADRVQLQQVLVNLLTNAIDSLRAARDQPRNIAIRSELIGQDVLLDISDNGIGIAEGDEERIFDLFFTTKATGTGLGLSLCRRILEEHGGRLWASHVGGRGATFHVQLPREHAVHSTTRSDRASDPIAVFRPQQTAVPPAGGRKLMSLLKGNWRGRNHSKLRSSNS